MESKFRQIYDEVCDGLIITDLESGLIVEANPAACLQHGCTREQFVGQRLADFIHPTNQQAFDEYFLQFQKDGVFEARLLHTCREGETFHAEWHGKAFNYQNRPSFLGVVRDVNLKVRSDQLLSRRADSREHDQEMLLAISHTLVSTPELQPGLVLDQLRETIKYTRGSIFSVEDATLVSLAMRGTSPLEQMPQVQIPLQSHKSLDILFNGHQPIRVADLSSSQTEAKFFKSFLKEGPAELREGMSSWMWVPLAVNNRLIGGLLLAHTRTGYFTGHHASLALSVANQVALTMVNAELTEQAQVIAVMEERQRLARNLHDAINQSLFTAGLIAEVLPRLWEQDQALARQSLKDLHRLTRSAQAEMRALLAELRPSTLTDTDLGELIKLLGYALAGRIDIPVVVNSVEDVELPSGVQIAFYRVCQEALNNIARHAGASQVDIDLQRAETGITLRIRDNGQGFDPDHTISGHYGLQMMRERAAAIGAEFVVNSQPGLGTELTMQWADSNLMEGK